jgi:hypothetical protein
MNNMWCGNCDGINVCVANVRGSAKFQHTCSKHKLIHLWFVVRMKQTQVDIYNLCGPWATFFTWPIPKHSYIITIASELNHMANHMHPYHIMFYLNNNLISLWPPCSPTTLKKSWLFKRFNLSKIFALTKKMFPLTKSMRYQKHMEFFGWFFLLKWPFDQLLSCKSSQEGQFFKMIN